MGRWSRFLGRTKSILISLNTFDTELTNYADTYPPSTVPCFGRKKWWFGVKNALGNPQVATRPIFALPKWECLEAGRYSNFPRWQIYVINTVDSTTLPLHEITVELFHSQEWPKIIFSSQYQYIFIRKAKYQSRDVAWLDIKFTVLKL